MAKALYRKYRPKKLSEITGQDHITATLSNALSKNVISHAYLLCGPRGTGKTSIARILAHEINGLSYDDGATHLDIIEIDAASNRRIDEIRDLRERVHVMPASARYKVYIIDEVHMLTKEAFNALLKTLEEPPAHVVFILATTEPHKLPETIISRTQRFNFRPIETNAAVGYLKKLARKEAIEIEPDAIKLIAKHGAGSFRDSISLLDQVSSINTHITKQDVETTLGIPPEETIEMLIKALEEGRPDQVVELLINSRDNGYLAVRTAKQLVVRLRDKLVEANSLSNFNDIYSLMRELIDIPASHDPEGMLEITLLANAMPRAGSGKNTPPKDEPVSSIEVVIEKPQLAAVPEKVEQKPKPADKEPDQTTNDAQPDDSWSQVLTTLKKSHNTLYGIARMAQAGLDGDTLTLELGFEFHRKRLSDDKNKQIITAIASKVTGRNIAVVCKLNKNKKSAAKNSTKDTEDPIDTISNIFGGAEMLE